MRVRRWSERRCTKAMLSGRSDVGRADHDVVEARTAETEARGLPVYLLHRLSQATRLTSLARRADAGG